MTSLKQSIRNLLVEYGFPMQEKSLEAYANALINELVTHMDNIPLSELKGETETQGYLVAFRRMEKHMRGET